MTIDASWTPSAGASDGLTVQSSAGAIDVDAETGVSIEASSGDINLAASNGHINMDADGSAGISLTTSSATS